MPDRTTPYGAFNFLVNLNGPIGEDHYSVVRFAQVSAHHLAFDRAAARLAISSGDTSSL